MQANEEYWGGRPFLDRVEIRLSRMERDQAVDFETSRADVVELPLAEVRRAQARDARVQITCPSTLVALGFDPSKPQLDRVREVLALSIDRQSMQAVLLQRQGEISGALLPQWLSGYAFLFPAKRHLTAARSLAGPPQAATFLYDRQNPLLRSIAERITLNADESGISLRPAPGPPADITLIALVAVADPKEALLQLTSFVHGAVPGTITEDPQSLFDAERTLIEAQRLLPLFHLPGVYRLRATVRGLDLTRSRAFEWKLADVWIGGS